MAHAPKERDVWGTRRSFYYAQEDRVAVLAEAAAAQCVQSAESNPTHRTERDEWGTRQEGYGVFSVSASRIDGVVAYIENRRRF